MSEQWDPGGGEHKGRLRRMWDGFMGWPRWAQIATVAVVVLVVVAAALSGSGEDDSSASDEATEEEPVTTSTEPESEPADDAPEVDWSKYAPTVQERIDALAASGDCAGLQDEFDTADANNDATRARTGEGNADLMAYIDYQLQSADCY